MYICLKCKFLFFQYFFCEFSWIFIHCHVPLKYDLHAESHSIVTYLYYDPELIGCEMITLLQDYIFRKPDF